jgi:hypothetical protein
MAATHFVKMTRAPEQNYKKYATEMVQVAMPGIYAGSYTVMCSPQFMI